MVEGDDFDVRVGAGVQSLRESIGMTQARLADAMSRAGHAWHQQTVVKTEKGLRPLRLAEALDLASVLHVGVTELDPRRAPSAQVDSVRRHLHEWTLAAGRFDEAAGTLATATQAVRQAATECGDALPAAVAAQVAAVVCEERTGLAARGDSTPPAAVGRPG